jgi:hypothetical protein
MLTDLNFACAIEANRFFPSAESAVPQHGSVSASHFYLH